MSLFFEEFFRKVKGGTFSVFCTLVLFKEDINKNRNMKIFNNKTLSVWRKLSIYATYSVVFTLFLVISGFSQELVKVSIKSEALEQERLFGVRLPKNYDAKSEKKYPVIYILDNFNQIATKFEALSEKGNIPEAILVGIHNMGAENRDRDLLPPYMKSNLEIENSPMGKGDKFLQFFETELIPYMKKNYHVSGVSALTGHSRGGAFVIYSLLAKPELFQARFAFSPAVWREDNLLVKKTQDSFTLPNKTESFLYMSLGDAENEKMKAGYVALTDVLTKQKPEKIVWLSEYTKDATHQTNVELSVSNSLEKWGEYLNKK